MLELNQVYLGDCLEVMKQIPNKSVNLILCDLPYGTTACAWDSVIDMEKLWQEYERIIKDNGAIVLTSQGMFTAELMVFRKTWFNHDYIWVKNIHSNHALTGIQPHRIFENVLVFRPPRHNDSNCQFNLDLRAYFSRVKKYIGLNRSQIDAILKHNRFHHIYQTTGKQFSLCTRETYEELINHFKIDQMDGFLSYDTLVSMNPPYTYNHGATVKKETVKKKNDFSRDIYGGKKEDKEYISKAWDNYPKNILYFDVERGLHPTQKPIGLFEFLIKTYSNEGDVVLDNCAGSGTTAIACINTKRQYICIEQDKKYYKVIQDRITKNLTAK